MPTYKQVVNHVKKHVLWKEEYFERYYRLNPELVQKRLDKIYQAKDDLMVLVIILIFGKSGDIPRSLASRERVG